MNLEKVEQPKLKSTATAAYSQREQMMGGQFHSGGEQNIAQGRATMQPANK
ncbi:MAG: hypothetical protein ACTFAK_08735 [Candidatus Electronema sp. VV]